MFLIVTLVVMGVGMTVGAAATCSFDEATATASVSVTTPEIERVGDAITVDGTPCDGATISNTDLIVTTDASRVTIDLRGGPFAPGLTEEADDSSEVEFSLEGWSGSPAILEIIGTEGVDRIKVATDVQDTARTILTGEVNLNAVEVPKDPDVRFPQASIGTVVVDGRGGADSVIAHGHGAEPFLAEVWFLGRGGDDRMEPGTPESGATLFAAGAGEDEFDVSWLPGASQVILALARGRGGFAEGEVTLTGVERLVGHDGPDTLIGGRKADQLIGLGGGDVLRGRVGDDRLAGGAGSDDLGGGDGIDRCDGTPADLRVNGCERSIG
jgi:Ca2+-binding RTX toxin-like protein